MTLTKAREWLARMAFRNVNTDLRYDDQGRRDEDGEACDPHAYVILGWNGIEREAFWGFVDLIRSQGHKGRYAPPYAPDRAMTNTYLQIDDWIYWFIWPKMLNRQHKDHQQHKPILEQDRVP